MLKTLSATAIGLVLFAAPCFAQKHDQAEAEKAARAFQDVYTQAFNAKDAKTIVAMFGADGTEAGPGPILTNLDDIKKRFETIFASGATNLRFDIKQVQAEGDIVFVVGTYTVSVPNSTITGGNVTNIYEWDGDALKYRVHSYNINMPPQK